MAGRSAHVNDFLLGRDNGEGQVSTCGQRGEERRDREHVAHGRSRANINDILSHLPARDIGERQVRGRVKKM
jgi:hypothetical protein